MEDRITTESATGARSLVPAAEQSVRRQLGGRGLPPGVAAVLPPFVASRFLAAAVTFLVALLRHAPALRLWQQWDAQWYLGIAAHGYGWSWNGKSPLAFFPLYPAIIHVAERVGMPPLASALCLSNVAFGLALWLLYRLTTIEYGSSVALKTVWLVAFLPTGLYFAAPYSESLFLLCALGALSSAGACRSLTAGLWTSGALLSRSTGFAVLAAVVASFVANRQQCERTIGSKGHRRGRGSVYASIAMLVLPCAIVLVVWLVALHAQGISPVDLLHAQRAWHRALAFPWMGFTTSLHWLALHGRSNLAWSAENILQVGVTVGFIGLTVKAWPELHAGARAYCLAFWVLSLSSPEWLDGYYAPLSSMTRFVLVLFPLYMWAAHRLDTRSYRRLLIVCASGSVACTCVYLTGGWVG